jgi:hypothetical protein
LNLVPTKISALGVELQSNDRHAIRVGLLIAVIYFLVTFLASALIDYRAWLERRRGAVDTRRSAKAKSERLFSEVQRIVAEATPDAEGKRKITDDQVETVMSMFEAQRRASLYGLLVPVDAVRGALDFGVPVGLAISATVILLKGLGVSLT